MSELTQCNYCNLQAIKREAKKNKQKVEVRPAKKDKYYLGGVDVFVDDKFTAWFMKLGDKCGC